MRTLALLHYLAVACSAGTSDVSGVVRLEDTSRNSSSIIVLAFPNRLINGQPIPMSKDELYDGLSRKMQTVSGPTTHAQPDGKFVLTDLPVGASYSFFAFDDQDGDGMLSLAKFEPCGWMDGPSSWWLSPVKIPEAGLANLSIVLPIILPLPPPKKAPNGRVHVVRGQTVLSLHGTASERGYAHGLLLGRHIVQFFRFFTLAETASSLSIYNDHILPMQAANYSYSRHPEYLAEARAMLKGMEASGADMRIPELGGRKLELADILYLNDYGRCV